MKTLQVLATCGVELMEFLWLDVEDKSHSAETTQ